IMLKTGKFRSGKICLMTAFVSGQNNFNFVKTHLIFISTSFSTVVAVSLDQQTKIFSKCSHT
ncbi:MAG: hypothetical protein MI923_16955, partial [Phycisphaerales bacterium]|nr:hypothetical protein [Phycisphaerales bacterium]